MLPPRALASGNAAPGRYGVSGRSAGRKNERLRDRTGDAQPDPDGFHPPAVTAEQQALYRSEGAQFRSAYREACD